MDATDRSVQDRYQTPEDAPPRSLARASLAKRVMDVVGSVMLLVVLALPMAVIALLIVGSSGRPAIFTQERPGIDGRAFRLWKFRTMRVPEGGDDRAPSDAERVTMIGRVLRATSLDELPELVNVLRGEMSLVGPRPLLLQYLPLYSPEQARRHDVRPGMTGLAQVDGRKALSWDETFALDVAYVDNWSIWLDLRIMARTAWALAVRAVGTSRDDFSRPDFTADHADPTIRHASRTTSGAVAWRPVGEMTLRPMTDTEVAGWKRGQGIHVIEHMERAWERVHPGFFQPVDLLEPLVGASASRPTPRAWGWRAAVVPGSDDVNAAIPVRLLEDLAGYDDRVLSGNRRSQLRKCRRSVEVVVPTEASALLEDGYELVHSSAERIGFAAPPRATYERTITAYLGTPGALVVMGLVEGRPAGFLTAHVGRSVAYIDHMYARTDALTTNVSLGLLFDFLLLCQRSDGIRQVAHGLERLENPGLGRFKQSMGFDLVEVPARIGLPRVGAALLRVRRPGTYHRLTGRVPGVPARGGELRSRGRHGEGDGTPAHSV